jgi:hypothetical protein
MLPGPGLQPGKYERGPLLIIETFAPSRQRKAADISNACPGA